MENLIDDLDRDGTVHTRNTFFNTVLTWLYDSNPCSIKMTTSRFFADTHGLTVRTVA